MKQNQGEKAKQKQGENSKAKMNKNNVKDKSESEQKRGELNDLLNSWNAPAK